MICELKKKNPDEFNTVYYGFEYLNSDATVFPFLKAIKYWQPYNLQ
ncbi:hypothetical protein [Spiroplasma endosymbiont of Virgichneumon dumeticola]